MEARHLNGIARDPRLDNLAWGTHAENIRDKFRHGTGGKLDEEHVREIRRLYSTGRYTQRVIGSRFGVSQPTVSLIVRGQLWNDI
jgi:hypothetical protein